MPIINLSHSSIKSDDFEFIMNNHDKNIIYLIKKDGMISAIKSEEELFIHKINSDFVFEMWPEDYEEIYEIYEINTEEARRKQMAEDLNYFYYRIKWD